VCVTVKRDELPVPALVRLTLQLLGCPNRGTAEKLAREIPFRFRGVACSIALEKFGLRLYIDPSTGLENSQLAIEIVRKLQATIRSLERGGLKDLAGEYMALGNVTIANQYPSLNSMYHFFRQAAAANYEQRDQRSPTDNSISSVFAEIAQSPGREHRCHDTSVLQLSRAYSC
jgi:hypothetical protein